jgi:hypothetical protein
VKDYFVSCKGKYIACFGNQYYTKVYSIAFNVIILQCKKHLRDFIPVSANHFAAALAFAVV